MRLGPARLDALEFADRAVSFDEVRTAVRRAEDARREQEANSLPNSQGKPERRAGEHCRAKRPSDASLDRSQTDALGKHFRTLMQVVSMTFECTAISRPGIEVDTAAVNLGGRNWQLNQRGQGWQYVDGLDR